MRMILIRGKALQVIIYIKKLGNIFELILHYSRGMFLTSQYCILIFVVLFDDS